MRWSDIAELVSVTPTTNDMGDATEEMTLRQVFVNKKSIRQSEFYQAQATGLRPELMIEVRSIEYEDEPKIIYDEKEYNIIRAHDKNGEVTELICQGLVSHG